MWGTVVTIGLGLVVVVILVALIMPGRKDEEPAADGRMSTEEMSAAQRDLWEQAERALRAYMNARGDEVASAREHMLRMADEADATVQGFSAQGASERQVLMAKLAAEEIREFINDALAQHPEGQQH